MLVGRPKRVDTARRRSERERAFRVARRSRTATKSRVIRDFDVGVGDGRTEYLEF